MGGCQDGSLQAFDIRKVHRPMIHFKNAHKQDITAIC